VPLCQGTECTFCTSILTSLPATTLSALITSRWVCLHYRNRFVSHLAVCRWSMSSIFSKNNKVSCILPSNAELKNGWCFMVKRMKNRGAQNSNGRPAILLTCDWTFRTFSISVASLLTADLTLFHSTTAHLISYSQMSYCFLLALFVSIPLFIRFFVFLLFLLSFIRSCLYCVMCDRECLIFVGYV
jgi:hypothetical protein